MATSAQLPDMHPGPARRARASGAAAGAGMCPGSDRYMVSTAGADGSMALIVRNGMVTSLPSPVSVLNRTDQLSSVKF